MSRKRRFIFGVFGILLAAFVIIQIIPIGRIYPIAERKPNPPVGTTIQWNSSETERIVRSSCYDCHSNETTYPWYAHVAPVSWVVSRDVNKGRGAMNFSADAPTEYDLKDLEWHLFNDMPPKIYLIMHPDAGLSDDQKDVLMTGFKETFKDASNNGMNMGTE